MAKSKYAHLVQPLRLVTESDDPSTRGKMIHLLYDGKLQPEPKRKATRKPKSM